MSELIRDLFPVIAIGMLLLAAASIYIYLIYLAFQSEYPMRNVITVLLLGLLSIPFLKKNTPNKFIEKPTLNNIKQQLAKELKLSQKEQDCNQSIISDLRIPFPILEDAVKYIALGYNISPLLIKIDKTSTLDELAQKIILHQDSSRIISSPKVKP